MIVAPLQASISCGYFYPLLSTVSNDRLLGIKPPIPMQKILQLCKRKINKKILLQATEFSLFFFFSHIDKAKKAGKLPGSVFN